MWSHIFLLFRRQPGKSTLTVSGFLLAACALILLSSTTQTTVLRANQIISQNWRPGYDLVVLPPQAHIPSTGVIPNDFLEGYDGGISIAQYQQIKNLPGIAVAAPIAFIGYVQMPVPKVVFSTQSLPDGFYQLDWTLTAFNGQHQVVENNQHSFFYHLSNCDTNPNALHLSEIADALNSKGILLDCTSSTVPISQFSTIDTGTFLLAAIDPSEENQLVHLDKSITGGRMLSAQDDLHPDPNPDISTVGICQEQQQLPASSCWIPNLDIPVLFHTQLPGQISLTGTFARLATGPLQPQTVIAHGGAAYLIHQPPQQTFFHGAVPLVQNDPQRFSAHQLVWDGQSWQAFGSGGDPISASLKFLYTASGLTYQSATAPTGQSSPAFILVPKGIQGPEAAFRTLNPLHIAEVSRPIEPYYGADAYTLPGAFYFFAPVGTFSGGTLNAQFSNPLNWLPENTYMSPPVILRYNSRGQPVTPTNLMPTTNHAGFLLQPPLALTTLSAAAHLRGNNIISAIRVRVNGVNAADPASWQRVQQAAALIEQRTHLHVLITLGSSPKTTLVYIPGVKQGQFGATQNIAPVGWVEERWITIGASILYITQVGITQFLLVGTVLLVCLGYLIVAFGTQLAAQRRDFAILSALGWPPWQSARIFLIQALLLGLGGGIVGLGVSLLLATLLGVTPLWTVVCWTVPVMLIMALLSSLYPLWQLWHIHPSELLRGSMPVVATKQSLPTTWSSHFSITLLAVRNLTRTRLRTCIAMLSLFFSAMLLVTIVSGTIALQQSLQGTLLGRFVLLQTVAPQITGCVLAVLLSFLNVSNLLLLQVHERQQEIGLLQAIGWRLAFVQRLFVREGVTLAILSTLPGVLVAQAILGIQDTTWYSSPALLIDIGAILLLTLLSALASMPALHLLSKMHVIDVLRAE